MGKDTRLVNIYLKIHNKKTLTMDDLAYLAKYAPECFEKTCQNVVYNFPESKPVMESKDPEKPREAPKEEPETKMPEWQHIDMVLDNLKRLEIHDFPVENIDTEKVKSLLGNLYMELLFPHNDKNTFIDVDEGGNKTLFDKKI